MGQSNGKLSDEVGRAQCVIALATQYLSIGEIHVWNWFVMISALEIPLEMQALQRRLGKSDKLVDLFDHKKKTLDKVEKLRREVLVPPSVISDYSVERLPKQSPEPVWDAARREKRKKWRDTKRLNCASTKMTCRKRKRQFVKSGKSGLSNPSRSGQVWIQQRAW